MTACRIYAYRLITEWKHQGTINTEGQIKDRQAIGVERFLSASIEAFDPQTSVLFLHLVNVFPVGKD